MAAYEMESCLRGYHVYDWQRSFDDEDRYAVAVLQDDTIVGHIPRNLFSVFSKAGWCYNVYAYKSKEIFFTPAAEYIYSRTSVIRTSII